ncbi:MAG: hypothetical protein WCJ72_14085 [Chryseobacterium sp.]
MKTFEIEINRIHAGSPYNCAYPPTDIKLNAQTADEAIHSPEIQDIINKTYGRELRVHVYSRESPRVPHTIFHVSKSKALLQ